MSALTRTISQPYVLQSLTVCKYLAYYVKLYAGAHNGGGGGDLKDGAGLEQIGEH